MKIRVPVGRESFESIIKSGSYYVDKTEILYDLVHEEDNQVALFTRPRRFGKTLTLRMMESFFDISRDSKALFASLNITEHDEFCREWMNQYPVLFVSFKDVEGLRFESAYGKLKTVLSDLCKSYSYLETSDKIDSADAIAFQNLRFESASDSQIQNSIKILTRMMYAHYGKPVILLIDEYDVPLAKSNEVKEGGERYYPQMLEIIRSIMSTALKSNDYLKFAVVTGCLRIAKESIFTGVNNFTSYSVLDEDFSQYFGFTQSEVDDLLNAADLSDKADVFKEWYDGYLFGDSALYCPWDVVNYVAALLRRPNARPKNYWKNTSGNGILREFVERREFRVKPKFETLMNGGILIQTVSDELTYDTLHTTENNLWSVLLMTGYLTKADSGDDSETAALRIPNKEIASIFQDTVVSLFSDSVDTEAQRMMMDAFWSGDEASASKAVSDLLWQTISYNDYHEDYYHAFLVGIFVGRGYSVESNKERGLGRPDIKLTDDDHRRVLIVEAKKSGSKEQMEQDCNLALQQIVEREYAKDLDEYDVFCYGISFYKKSALVKKL